MASCVPVIAANAGGMASVIKHGETGFLLVTADEEEISNMLATALGVPVSRELEGLIDLNVIVKNARELVEQRYSAGAMAEKYAGLYREDVR